MFRVQSEKWFVTIAHNGPIIAVSVIVLETEKR
jgi:hypothetical protein